MMLTGIQKPILTCTSHCRMKRNVLSISRTLMVFLTLISFAWTDARLPVVSAATATTASSARNVTLRVVQQATTDGTTRSLSFLSSGYQSESAFLSDVAACVSTLTNSTGGVSSDPWPRYIALFNIYALYEPSPQLGASRVKSHEDSCAFMGDCTAGVVDNNLRCSFGTPNPQLLSCDANLVRSLATYAPSQDVAVVLVNDAEASGAGSDGLLYITNSPTFMSFMLVHYLNRAVAGLQEEYDLGIRAVDGRQTFTALNCAATNSTAEQQWSYWRNYNDDGLPTTEDGNGDESIANGWGVGCSVASYAAPTHGGCLMQNSSIHHMCPVCKEQLSLSLHDAGVPSSVLLEPSAERLNLAAGRCPPSGYTSYVAPAALTSSDATPMTRHLYLSLGPFALRNDVEVVWTAPNGTVLATNTQTLVVENVSSVWQLPATVTATIFDASPNVRPDRRAEWRDNMTSTTTFTVMEWADGVNCASSAAMPACFSSRAAFAELTALPSSACALPVPAAVTTASTVRNLPALDASVHTPSRDTVAIIISSAVCGGLTLLVVVIVALVFCCCVLRRPREVLNPTRTDTAVYCAAAVMAPLGIAAAGLTIAIVCSFVPVVYYTASPVVLTVLVMACVMFVTAALNFCGVLFRWFVGVLVCGILSFLLGAGFLATGLFSLVFYLDRGSRDFSDRAGQLWLHLLSTAKGTAHVCDTVQASLKCSGYHAGCFMTTSAECPLNCSNNAHFVNSCEVPFMYYIGGLYLPIAIVALACGFWYVLLGTLDMTYYVRFRRLPRNGRLRRTFRTTPKPPMAPITHQEVLELRRQFAQACAKTPAMTMQGPTAVRFLETVFAEPLSETYKELLRTRGPLTFDALMTMHFPYAMQRTRPTQAPQEGAAVLPIREALSQVDYERAALPDMDRYPDEAGSLSPEALQRLLHTHRTRQPTSMEPSLLQIIRKAAAQDESADFFRGLSATELAGLRRVWTALHPSVTGTLTDAELKVFYDWSHTGSSPLSEAGLVKWKEFLDVTHSGAGIGWREFCYPYAQKALNREAHAFLLKSGCAIPPGVVSRAVVADRYGSEECSKLYLPREKTVPMERAVAHFLALPPSPSVAAGSPTQQRSLTQRADGIVKRLKKPLA